MVSDIDESWTELDELGLEAVRKRFSDGKQIEPVGVMETFLAS